jgi:hypothetical protein
MIQTKNLQNLTLFSDGCVILSTNLVFQRKKIVTCLSKDLKMYQSQYKKKDLKTLAKVSNIENYRKQLFK